VSVSIYSVSEGQTTPLPTSIVGQVVSERNVSLLFSDELDSGCCHAVLLVDEKEKFRICKAFVFYKQALLKTFYLDGRSTLLFYQI
jgi:hypothetical protein